MDLTTQEKALIEKVRAFQSDNIGFDGFIVLHLSPLDPDNEHLINCKTANPVSRYEIRPKLNELFSDFQKWFGDTQTTFVVFYDNGRLRFLTT